MKVGVNCSKFILCISVEWYRMLSLQDQVSLVHEVAGQTCSSTRPTERFYPVPCVIAFLFIGPTILIIAKTDIPHPWRLPYISTALRRQLNVERFRPLLVRMDTKQIFFFFYILITRVCAMAGYQTNCWDGNCNPLACWRFCTCPLSR